MNKNQVPLTPEQQKREMEEEVLNAGTPETRELRELSKQKDELNLRVFEYALENERLKSELMRSEVALKIARYQIGEPILRPFYLLENDDTSDVLATVAEFMIEERVFVLLSDFQSITSELQRLMCPDALKAREECKNYD